MNQGFSITVDGLEAFNRSFLNLERRVSDFREGWPEVQRVFLEIEADQFASGGGKGASGAWKELAESTQAQKGFLGGIILVDTGELKASLSRKGASGQVYDPQATELTLGTTVAYAVFHQRGTKRMPARPPIDMSEESKRKIQKSIQKGLVDFVRRQTFYETEFTETVG